MLRSLLHFFKKEATLRPLARPAARQVQSLEQFHHQVHRETVRADAHGSPFALVSFTFPTRKGPSPLLLQLGSIAVKRCRISDDVGWYDADCMAALLPETPHAGAWAFAQKVADEFERAAGLLPLIEVFIYPDSLGEAPENDPAAIADAPPAPRTPPTDPPPPDATVAASTLL